MGDEVAYRLQKMGAKVEEFNGSRIELRWLIEDLDLELSDLQDELQNEPSSVDTDALLGKIRLLRERLDELYSEQGTASSLAALKTLDWGGSRHV